MTRRSGPGRAASQIPAKDQGRGYLRLVEEGEDRAPRAQLAVMPADPPELLGVTPGAPPNTSTEWLVSWCWPARPDQVRRKVFHDRTKAEAMRARLERGFDGDGTPATVNRSEMIVRIDARHCSPWVEVA